MSTPIKGDIKPKSGPKPLSTPKSDLPPKKEEEEDLKEGKEEEVEEIDELASAPKPILIKEMVKDIEAKIITAGISDAITLLSKEFILLLKDDSTVFNSVVKRSVLKADPSNIINPRELILGLFASCVNGPAPKAKRQSYWPGVDFITWKMLCEAIADYLTVNKFEVECYMKQWGGYWPRNDFTPNRAKAYKAAQKLYPGHKVGDWLFYNKAKIL